MKHTIAIIGGGAAGFFGAITAATAFPDSRVVLFEKGKHVLGKVRISGGGRCNVTNAAPTLSDLLKGYPRGARFLKHLFPRFSNQDTIRWFAERGVELKTEPDGRLFPVTDSSGTIVDCLRRQAQKAGVELLLSTGIRQLEPEAEGFLLQTTEGDFHASRVLVTTGGHPQQDGYSWLTRLGIATEPPVPSLFTFNVPGSFLRDLPGVSVPEALVRIAGTSFQYAGPLLVTHWGLSGPAVLKLSAFAARELAAGGYRFQCLVNWTGEKPEPAREQLEHFRKANSGKQLGTVAPFALPNRLWRAFLAESGNREDLRWSDLTGKPFHKLHETLTNSVFEVEGKTTFKEEFVTCGGISLSEIDPKTLQHKKIPGLFFAGEVVDIDGITGGFNFQAAWTTAFIAGSSIGL